MKKLILLFLIANTLQNFSHAQVDWSTLGNNALDATDNFVGNTDGADLRFRTNNTERLTITGTNGWLGVNTMAPLSRFHLLDGNFLLEGPTIPGDNLFTGGSLPAYSGVRARLLWVDGRAAFRTGTASGTQWDLTNIGTHSVAMGFNCRASGAYSIAMGQSCTSSNVGCVAMGDAAVASGHDAIALGETVEASGDFCVALGHNITASGDGSFAAGNGATASGHGDIALGSSIASGGASVSVGVTNTASGLGSFAIGKVVQASGTFAMGYGCFMDLTGANSMGIGAGLSTNNLVNSINNSLVVGFNSNVPTLFVGGGNGTAGSSGNVGIGNITAPSQRLDVNGTARLRSVAAGTPNALLTGVGTAGDVVVNRLDFNGNANNFLGGNGTWQCHFEKSGNNLFMGNTGGCSTGSLGIGTASPTSKLHIANNANSGNISSVLITSTLTTSGDNTNIACAARAMGGGGNITGIMTSAVANGNGASGNGGTIFGLSAAASANSGNSEFSGFHVIYGIYASAGGDSTTNGDIYAGYFDGDVFTTGSYLPSDETLKSNILPLESSLDKVLAIEVVTYEYNQDETGNMNLPNGQQIGYTAQNIGEFYPVLIKHATQPSAVDEDGNVLAESFGFDAVNYTGMVPVLHKAIQEQQNLINSLSESVEALTLQIESCCADTKNQESTPDHSIDVKLSNESNSVLFQNTPNPHQGECVIRYFIPESTTAAEIQFFDARGGILKIIVLQQNGLGQINLDAKELANGIYTYALIVDGNAVDMKKMVKE